MSNLSGTLSASEARSNLYTLLEEIAEKYRHFKITRHGRVQAAVMPVEEMEAWEETMEVMGNTKLLNDISQGQKDLTAGKTVSQKALLKQAGIDPKDLE
jgi:prevent-host-death family protein